VLYSILWGMNPLAWISLLFYGETCLLHLGIWCTHFTSGFASETLSGFVDARSAPEQDRTMYTSRRPTHNTSLHEKARATAGSPLPHLDLLPALRFLGPKVETLCSSVSCNIC
jgi:hypothetical protein